jgi:hypothetical protein
VIAGLFGGLAGWLVVVVADALDVVAPQVPWTAPLGVVLIAAMVGVLAWTTHQRIQVRRERVEPHRAVAFLVLGKASALGGAMVGAGYLVFALMFVARWEADAPRERVIRAGIAVLAGIALAVAGLFLERSCRVPRDDDRDDDYDADEQVDR